MGTLFDQPKRKSMIVSDEEASNKLLQINTFAISHAITYEEAFKIFELLEYSRRTNFMIQNGNVHDEQISGLGEIIQSFVDKVDFIAKKLDERL